MNIVGTIKKIQDVQVITPSFKKREFVITTQEQYPQDILLELTQEKTDILNKYKAGDVVNASINIRGREWINPEGVAKYFNTIQVWAMEPLTNSMPQENGSNPVASAQPVFTPVSASNGDDDDLPF